MKNIVKSFGPVKALKGVNLDLRPGEVHALMGENGAGKSTLMKVLTGIYSADEGTIIYNGQQVRFSKPIEAMDAGIVIVHQELNMMNHLTVAQNIFIGREKKKGILLDDNESVKQTQELFKLLKLNINPNEKAGNLTVGKQQMVEIAKALSMNAKIIVFDEPTAALTESEINELFAIIADLRQKGVGIVYISHRMDEIARITDRVTVMRDGEYVGTVNTRETTKDDIISMMVGRTIYEDPKECSTVPEGAPIVLKVENLNSGNAVKNVSFELRKGEILGFSGLMGAGRTEVARLIFGADKKDSGTITVNGTVVDIKTPQDAIKAGIGYLSEDRKQFGCIVDMTIANNTVMTNLDKYVQGGLINDKKIVEVSDHFVKQLRTKTPSSKQLIRNLSGGNQQKVVIAKWLEQDSDILIFDEPTRGIDVGAKSEIYKLMNDLAASGKSIIMISSELTEILRMSDRIVVMCEGRKTGELDISEATQERILALATDR
ncbi:sugar ABC transporter ATP-binding protein [Aerococcaceae bacterium zg-ZJ1578]|nr:MULTISPECIES: sugar ABC transporter ATP-binding protein [unclassified Facklamia]MBK0347626.1 sugar ABC transporter ATP-binding protein [Aerococcaceae bacterium zg-1578]MBR7927372.1 sugar ABC transporter ATP-binding protein [Aerococcaceae bacterium zg-ZUI334]MBS4461425.1 sugar ABC transporter ATP-binding protein [Aerococcaceae bacterium zg-B36]QQD66470.1 sugar ABC transporter ATP-binding protein [Aerococcaceae bacterium zg-252]NEW64102.1 ATP-binding cassette domain-containing protein [Fackla